MNLKKMKIRSLKRRASNKMDRTMNKNKRRDNKKVLLIPNSWMSILKKLSSMLSS